MSDSVSVTNLNLFFISLAFCQPLLLLLTLVASSLLDAISILLRTGITIAIAVESFALVMFV